MRTFVWFPSCKLKFKLSKLSAVTVCQPNSFYIEEWKFWILNPLYSVSCTPTRHHRKLLIKFERLRSSTVPITCQHPFAGNYLKLPISPQRIKFTKRELRSNVELTIAPINLILVFVIFDSQLRYIVTILKRFGGIYTVRQVLYRTRIMTGWRTKGMEV